MEFVILGTYQESVAEDKSRRDARVAGTQREERTDTGVRVSLPRYKVYWRDIPRWCRTVAELKGHGDFRGACYGAVDVSGKPASA